MVFSVRGASSEPTRLPLPQIPFPRRRWASFMIFSNHIRQNGEVTPIWRDSIVINDERARREIKLLDHPRLKAHAATNRPTFGSVLGLIMVGPTPPLPLIHASEACDHLRKHLLIRGRVTEIGANRRGDAILRFGSSLAMGSFFS